MKHLHLPSTQQRGKGNYSFCFVLFCTVFILLFSLSVISHTFIPCVFVFCILLLSFPFLTPSFSLLINAFIFTTFYISSISYKYLSSLHFFSIGGIVFVSNSWLFFFYYLCISGLFLSCCYCSMLSLLWVVLRIEPSREGCPPIRPHTKR